eukprot:COSAG02_NODE_287_length_25647_cov_245.259316_15_plen_105_part_00
MVVMVVREDPGVSAGHTQAEGSRAMWPRLQLQLLPLRRRLGGAGRPTQTVACSDSSPYIRHRTGCERALRSSSSAWDRRLLVACGSRAEWCTAAAWDYRMGPDS